MMEIKHTTDYLIDLSGINPYENRLNWRNNTSTLYIVVFFTPLEFVSESNEVSQQGYLKFM